MGIKTDNLAELLEEANTLKNLPTPWGLRPSTLLIITLQRKTLKNLPTTWGLRPVVGSITNKTGSSSEKPPHHMGIKTPIFS